VSRRSLAAARAVPALLRAGFAEAVAYRAEFFVWFLAYTTPLIMLALWTAVAREQPIAGFDERAFQAYFLVTLVVRVSTSSWVVWEMNFDIRQGTLTRKLLRPLHPLLAYACENLAALPLRLLMTGPVMAATLIWLGPGILVRDPVHVLIVPLTLAGAWALMFCWMAIIGSLALWSESSLKVFDAWLGLIFLFSGYVMPLDLYPPRMRAVLDLLPFRSMLSFPVENLIGRMDRGEALLALGIQWAHVGLALAILLFAWRRGVRRFQAFGG
jgi:ABC-2 type transport system permease protein